MKKIFSVVCLFVAFGLLVGCEKTNVQQISITPAALQMTVGEIQMLTVENATETVQWSSSDEAVVLVHDGAVTATGVGNAIVTATCGKSSATATVYVMGKSGETISLTPELVVLEKGKTYQYHYTSVYDIPLTWTSSNPSVATVDQNGLVTAVSGGNTYITLTNGVETVKSRVSVSRKWGDYSLVWEEPFDGTSLNTDVWTIEVNGAGGGNNELQYYTDRPENLRVEDGNLVIELRKEEYLNKHYTSGRINSREKKAFAYGKVEARILFPEGGGTWPAFWMMGNDYRRVGWPACGEIDIIEHVGNQPRMASFALHTPKKNGQSGNNWYSRAYLDGLENEYHVYGIEWLQEDYNGLDRIIFSIDGHEYANILEDAAHVDENAYWPFNKEHFIILNLAVGGSMGGNVDDSMFEHDVLMKVDWVRVYQREEK